MSAEVILAPEALRDIGEIHDFLLAREEASRADKVLADLERAVFSLAENADRGHYVPEIVDLGRQDILEIHFKPFRILYRLAGKKVFVLVVADGRRDFHALLARRIMR